MQFDGAKGIALFVGIILVACGAGFGSGLLVGRQFPAHRYERFGDSNYLLDTTTGKVCDIGPLPGLKEAGKPETSDFLKSLNTSYPLPCGK